MMRKLSVLPLMFVAFLCFNPGLSEARGIASVARGGARILAAPLAIPATMIQHSKRVMFPFGLVTGAVAGTFKTVFGTVGGATEAAQGAAPYAKYAVFL